METSANAMLIIDYAPHSSLLVKLRFRTRS